MDNIYCYPYSDVLINRFNIRDLELLSLKERQLTTLRLIQLAVKPICGDFGLKHLQKIHKYIFQDLYEWAGEIRNVNIGKGNWFCLTENINSEADRIFQGIRKENYLKDLNIDNFSDRISYYASEINALHPFREGNGRTTREFIRCLAIEAGYEIEYSNINKDQLFNAFVKSFIDYSDLKEVFKESIIKTIKNNYKNKLPNNFIFSEELLNNLHSLKALSKDGSYLSLEIIRAIASMKENKNLNNSIYKVADNINKEIDSQYKKSGIRSNNTVNDELDL